MPQPACAGTGGLVRRDASRLGDLRTIRHPGADGYGSYEILTGAVAPPALRRCCCLAPALLLLVLSATSAA
jgi:hypothetical protein